MCEIRNSFITVLGLSSEYYREFAVVYLKLNADQISIEISDQKSLFGTSIAGQNET